MTKTAILETETKLTLTFEFPLPATLTLNKQIYLARSHWSTSSKHREEWKDYLSGIAMEQLPDNVKTKKWLEIRRDWKNLQLKNPKKVIQFDYPIFTNKTWFSFHWVINSRANDHDNVDAACKFIDDSLVAAGIIKDDNFMCIGSYVGHSFEFIPKTKEPKIKLRGKSDSKLFLPEDLLFNPTNQKVIVFASEDKDNWMDYNNIRMKDAN
jgi:hypothetical protein